MESNDIIKTLEGAILDSKRYDSKVWLIAAYKLENAIDLINRQQAEIDRLNKEIQITEDAYTMLQTKIEIVKSEAYKEFCEKRGIKYVEDDV